MFFLPSRFIFIPFSPRPACLPKRSKGMVVILPRLLFILFKNILFFCLVTLIPASSPAQYWRWTKQVTGTQYEDGAGIAYSINGNVYSTGEYTGTAGYDTDTFPQPPPDDAFYLVALKNDGSTKFTRHWNGFSNVASKAIDADDNENIFIAGGFNYSIYFEDDTLTIFRSAIR